MQSEGLEHIRYTFWHWSLSGWPHRSKCSAAIQDETLIPTDRTPSTLMEWGVVILNTANPTLKVERTKHAVHLFRTGQLTSIGHKPKNVTIPPAVPPRDENSTRNTVDPKKLGKRKNAEVMLHALANIEQWA
ncbi:hypothetical protein BU15DRAFT_63414 [Melanogaster broomeanus]|nr:hypothetical protein BU15DRAFT_63414 [Melanogaster broomeanus]